MAEEARAQGQTLLKGSLSTGDERVVTV